MQKNIVSFGFAVIAPIAVLGCHQSSAENEGVQKNNEILIESLNQPEETRSEPSRVEIPTTESSLIQNVPKNFYVELCSKSDFPDYEGEAFSIVSRPIKAFKRANRVRFKFGPTVYDSRMDYNNDGIRDFYLTAPGYNYSSVREDYTEFYIVPGTIGKSETPEPDFKQKALKRVLFSQLNRNTFQPRNPPDITKEGNFITTAKATPVEFKNQIYLKIHVQFAQAGKPVYRSAYYNSPDWTTYVRINHRMELQPIC